MDEATKHGVSALCQMNLDQEKENLSAQGFVLEISP